MIGVNKDFEEDYINVDKSTFLLDDEETKTKPWAERSHLRFSIFSWVNCCGIREVGSFGYRNLSDALIKKMKEILDNDADDDAYCFAHLVITKEMSDHELWDELIRANFPGTRRSRWRVNPNSGNAIRFYTLPVGTQQ